MKKEDVLEIRVSGFQTLLSNFSMVSKQATIASLNILSKGATNLLNAVKSNTPIGPDRAEDFNHKKIVDSYKISKAEPYGKATMKSHTIHISYTDLHGTRRTASSILWETWLQLAIINTAPHALIAEYGSLYWGTSRIKPVHADALKLHFPDMIKFASSVQRYDGLHFVRDTLHDVNTLNSFLTTGVQECLNTIFSVNYPSQVVVA